MAWRIVFLKIKYDYWKSREVANEATPRDPIYRSLLERNTGANGEILLKLERTFYEEWKET